MILIRARLNGLTWDNFREDESDPPNNEQHSYPHTPPKYGVRVGMPRVPHYSLVDVFSRHVGVDDGDDHGWYEDKGE